jgi:DNA polymerase-1
MPSGAAIERVYLIDAHSLIFQVFHAIPEMTSPSGLPTNAIFGFTRDLLFLRGLKPAYILCAFDEPGPTFRDIIYKEYKAHRAPMPDDLSLQLPYIRDLIGSMGIPVLGRAGFEADDVIATLAAAAEARGMDVFICTSDKDCRQLISDHVRLYNIRKQKDFGRQELLEDWGVTPEQVVDLQTLVGDSVDNVPGVPGVGVKTAAKLLQEYGTLDKLLEEIRDQKSVAEGRKAEKKVVGPKIWESLKSTADKLAISRKLVTLDRNMDMAFDWDGWRLRDWDAPRLLQMFQQFGFRSFADQVRQSAVGNQKSEGRGRKSAATRNGSQQAAKAEQLDLFLQQGEANDGQPLTADWQATYHVIDKPAKFEEFLTQLKKQMRFAVDLETTGAQPLEADVVGYAFCWQAGEAYYLPVRGPADEPALDPVETLEALRPIFEDPKVAKINQNVKYDIIVLRGLGVDLAGVAGDSMVADYLLQAGERSHGMDELSRRYLGHAPVPVADIVGKNGKSQLRLDQVPTAKIGPYAAEKADIAYRLCAFLEPQLAGAGVDRLYRDLEVPLIGVLAELEFNGIRLGRPLLARLSKEMTQQLAGIERSIYDLAGHEFNIASLKQLRTVLFDDLKLPVQRKTGIAGEASTDQETLERLAALGYELPRKIVEHRQISKLKGTYVDALPALVNAETGRIHASFNQTVAATGRLSGSDPNLQNIPIRTEMGGQIRQAFLPEEGWHLLTADYSQVELRLLAHFCGDEELRQAFAFDRDIHTVVAAQIYGVAENEVQPEMRRMAKTVNFGVIYGMSAYGLAQRLGIPRDQASQFIDAYFARYPKVLEYQAQLLRDCARNQYVSTILGRRRAITGIRLKSSYQQRNQPEREAINMQIQGSAADLIKQAMLNIYRRLKREGRKSRMLLQIHDELVFEVPPDELAALMVLVEEEMTTSIELEVPLRVDISVGANWLDVAEMAVA